MNILKHIPKSINKLYPKIYPIKAKDCFIYTKYDKYLDLTSGIGATSTGHSHPYISKKIKEQVDKYVHMPQQIFKSHPAQVELTDKILKTMPFLELDNIFYVNSGSEGTDNAIKIARNYTNKSNIICMNKGFHGRTLGALSITSSNTTFKKNLNSLLSNIYCCNYPTIESFDLLLNHQSHVDDTAAIILEPIQGEGGIFSIESEFLMYVKKICDENNILLISDEVQCGSMRTGTWWNIEQKNVIPDIIVFGKGIASGYPLAGIISRSEIMNSLEVGALGGTYGGNAICSVAASATIDIINECNLKNNVNYLGKFIKESLQDELLIKEIRQHGLMIGIEFNKDIIKQVINELKEEKILVLTCGNKGQYLRLLPPLNISKQNIEIFIYTLKNILSKY